MSEFDDEILPGCAVADGIPAATVERDGSDPPDVLIKRTGPYMDVISWYGSRG